MHYSSSDVTIIYVFPPEPESEVIIRGNWSMQFLPKLRKHGLMPGINIPNGWQRTA